MFVSRSQKSPFVSALTCSTLSEVIRYDEQKYDRRMNYHFFEVIVRYCLICYWRYVIMILTNSHHDIDIRIIRNVYRREFWSNAFCKTPKSCIIGLGHPIKQVFKYYVSTFERGGGSKPKCLNADTHHFPPWIMP